MHPDSTTPVDDGLERAVETPSIGRIVVYRSRTGDYDVPAIITATQDTLYQPNVDSGHVPEITAPLRVHLRAFTPGEDGGYAEFDVPYGGALEDADDLARTWRWPRSDTPPFAREPAPEPRFEVGDRVVVTGQIPSTPYHVDRAPGTVGWVNPKAESEYRVELDTEPRGSIHRSWWIEGRKLEPEPEQEPGRALRFKVGDRVVATGRVPNTDTYLTDAHGEVAAINWPGDLDGPYCVRFDSEGSWNVREHHLEPEPEAAFREGERVFVNGDIPERTEAPLQGLEDCAAVVVDSEPTSTTGRVKVRLVDERVPEHLQAMSMSGFDEDRYTVWPGQVTRLSGDTDELKWKARAAKYRCYLDPVGNPTGFAEVPRDRRHAFDLAKLVVRRDTGEIVKWST